jgi:hypothetical protein
MTVSASTSRADYTGNGTTTVFSVPFYFLDNTHLLVYKTTVAGVTSTMALTTDYTVTGAGSPSGGSITMAVAPSSGETIAILRNVPLDQTTNYVANDPFPAESHESALDKLTMIAQQLYEKVNRAFVYPAQVAGVSLEAPSPEASQILGWNSTATALINYAQSAITSSQIISSFIQPLLTTTNGTDARAVIGAANAASVLNLSGGTMTGAVDMGSHKITGVTSGAATGEAVEYSQITSLYQKFDQGLITRDVSLASGTSTVTTTFQPKVIKFACISSSGGSISYSFGAEDIAASSRNSIFGNSAAVSNNTNKSITMASGATIVYDGYVSAVTSTSFTITWVRTGTPTGNGFILWEAIG